MHPVELALKILRYRGALCLIFCELLMPEGGCRVIEGDSVMGGFKLGQHLEDHGGKAIYRPGRLPRLGHCQRGQGVKGAMDQGIAIEEDKKWFIIGHLRHIIIRHARL